MGISIWQLLIVLAIVVVLFGTKKLRNMGGDLGAAIRNFKNAVNEGESEKQGSSEKLEQKGNVIEGEATREKDKDKDKV